LALDILILYVVTIHVLDVQLDVDVDCNKEYNNIKELRRQLTIRATARKK